jgi:hypothetical protein
MLRTALLMVLFASPALAQDSVATLAASAGCGPNEVHFDVKTTKQHPTGQPQAGKALIYVIGDSWGDRVAIHVGTPPTRFGLDGTWVGANGYHSYFYFSVDPGDHRLCTSVQSPLESLVKSSLAAASFTAEAGQSYYFRTATRPGVEGSGGILLLPVDPAEAQILMAEAEFSTFRQKK